jgi:oligosaccharide repeat unit polymerase
MAVLRHVPIYIESKSRRRAATIVLVLGLALTGASMPTDEAMRIFGHAAIGVAISLGISIGMELTAGLRNLLRADIIMLITLFGLTFVEFLFPSRSMFDFFTSSEGAINAVVSALIAFAGIGVGRHFVSEPIKERQESYAMDLSEISMFRIFILAFFLGYLHILFSVNFDLFEALRQMAEPRFAQSWARGRFGGWSDLLVEVGGLIYLIPPLAGCIFAQEKHYSATQKAIVAVLFLFTMYYGFSGGTRNIFGVYMLTFCSSYIMLKINISKLKLLTFIALMSVMTLVSMYYMLDFRTVGLGNYSFGQNEFVGVFVDSNMVVIAKLSELFPNIYDYLGLEIPYSTLIRPIPRALWPEKPEGLSIGIEKALGVEGLTLAATFIGEAYIAGGILAVLVTALLFGAVAGKWNAVWRTSQCNLDIVIYVSGFFFAALSMRSLLSSLPALMPTLGLWLYSRYILVDDCRNWQVKHLRRVSV